MISNSPNPPVAILTNNHPVAILITPFIMFIVSVLPVQINIYVKGCGFLWEFYQVC